MGSSKSLLSLFALVLPSVLAAALIPRQDSNSTCTSPLQRKSWTSLTDTEKSEYISAELCLMSAAPQNDIPRAQSRWDELQYLHAIQANFVHGSGQFLPWHRYFVAVHEQILREECNYTGAQPYWDEAADVDDFPNIDIFDPETGFGGGGSGDLNCVQNGPFANTTLHIDLSDQYGDYCLNRSLSSSLFSVASQSQIDACMAMTDYASAWPCYEGNLHNAGHSGVGGIMFDVSLSPGDPLFYMHHANLDRLWWQWQQANLTARLTDMAGSNIPSASSLSFGNLDPPSIYLTEYDGDPGNITTLNHVLWMHSVKPNVTVGDVMDLGGSTICADYV